ncbi:MAG: hypothetical protein ACLFV2_08455 [Desulfurivibrionaceae bacterium]
MYKPIHCPGFEDFKHLESFVCKCNNCGKEIEIFSDEFNREHHCPECRQLIDFSRCQYYAGGDNPTKR